MAAHKMEIAQRKNAEGDGERRPKSEKKRSKARATPSLSTHKMVMLTEVNLLNYRTGTNIECGSILMDAAQ